MEFETSQYRRLARRAAVPVTLAVLFSCIWLVLIPPQELSVAAPAMQQEELYAIASELWCPLCAGVRLDMCELQACVQMREEIEMLLAEGQDRDYIVAYFEEQYGPQVHGQPPFAGLYGWAWWTPLLLLAAAGFAVFSRMRRAAALRASVRSTPSAGAGSG